MFEEFFAKRLALLRNEKGVSARDMSLSIGQNPSYINSIETGKSLPSMSAFFYICEYLEISPKDFFEENIQYPNMFQEMIENAKKLDYKQLQTINAVIQYMTK